MLTTLQANLLHNGTCYPCKCYPAPAPNVDRMLSGVAAWWGSLFLPAAPAAHEPATRARAATGGAWLAAKARRGASEALRQARHNSPSHLQGHAAMQKQYFDCSLHNCRPASPQSGWLLGWLVRLVLRLLVAY